MKLIYSSYSSSKSSSFTSSLSSSSNSSKRFLFSLIIPTIYLLAAFLSISNFLLFAKILEFSSFYLLSSSDTPNLVAIKCAYISLYCIKYSSLFFCNRVSSSSCCFFLSSLSSFSKICKINFKSLIQLTSFSLTIS